MTKNQSTLSDNTEHVNPALHCFVNMFYAQAFKQLFEYAENRPDGVLPIPVHVLCDDFATGSRVYADKIEPSARAFRAILPHNESHSVASREPV